ncbi:uncharacterized protein LOC119107576 isoform X2 [Pollicipes pollicipes]|uniref:uncharacterized protein LOC119107576 isoform X2 n=1 Tax=Pollicipes pollicipes TaxID=41117 RepID=UPI001885037D|nr:uncharacterized protein LOC119107576 isoform X2 [Pollicipes pollicipes]
MWKLLVIAVVCVQLCCAQYPRYLRFPVGRGDDTKCHDNQVDKKYNIGDVWSSPFSGCKQSHCIKDNGVLYIDRFQCPSVRKQVDFKKLKANNLFCREARGDRRKEFPDCCARLVCKHYVDGKLVPLPAHKYPLL